MDTTPRYTLVTSARFEETVRKSRFLALAHSVLDPGAAMAFLTQHVYTDASHHCWAYRVGDSYRFSDDGEPGGTAGRPILQAIDSQQCDRVVVLVVRWFGGIKLGTGGLVRAYGGAAAQCLRLAEKSLFVEEVCIDCHCAFAEIALARARLKDFSARLAQENFDAQGVAWRVMLPEERAQDFLTAFAQWTRGRGRAQLCEA